MDQENYIGASNGAPRASNVKRKHFLVYTLAYHYIS